MGRTLENLQLQNSKNETEFIVQSKIPVGKTYYRLLPAYTDLAMSNFLVYDRRYYYKKPSENTGIPLICYSTFDLPSSNDGTPMPSLIKAVIEEAFKTADDSIAQTALRYLESTTRSSYEPKIQYYMNLLFLVKNPANADEFLTPSYFYTEGTPNPMIMSVSSEKIVGALKKLVLHKDHHKTFLEASQGHILELVKTPGKGSMQVDFELSFLDTPDAGRESKYFTDRAAVPNIEQVILNKVKHPKYILNFMLNTFLGDELCPKEAALEGMKFDPMSATAGEELTDFIKTNVNKDLFRMVLRKSHSVGSTRLED